MWDSLPGRRQSGFADAGSALTTVLMAVVVVCPRFISGARFWCRSRLRCS
jgi:hypothetical protein